MAGRGETLLWSRRFSPPMLPRPRVPDFRPSRLAVPAVALSLLLLPTLAAPATAEDDPTEPYPNPLDLLDMVDAGIDLVPFETLTRTYVPFGLPAYAVIRDQDALDAFYALHIGSAAPTVDFDEKTVLAAVSGTRNQDCGFGITTVYRLPLGSVSSYVATVFGGTPYTGSLICLQVVNNKAHVVAVDHEGGLLSEATFHDQRTKAVIGAGAAP